MYLGAVVLAILQLFLLAYARNCSSITAGCVEVTGPSTLYILSLLPYPDDNPALQPSWDEGPTLFLAEQLAVEHINNRHDILQDYHLELVQGDSGCNIKSKAMLAFVEHVLASGKQIVGIVGPGCSTSTAVVSPLSGRDEIALLMIHIAGSLFLTDREKYPYSFGTLDSTEVFVDTLVALMKKNSWYQVATLYDESRVYYYSTLLSFEQKVRNLPDYSVALSSAVYDTYIPFNALEQAKVRVIFLLVGPDFLGKIFCLAYHKDFLYPKYQWVIVSRTFDEVIMATEFKLEGKHYSCTKDELKKAADGNVIIHYKLTPFNTSKTTDTGFSYSDVLSTYKEHIEISNGALNIPISASFWAPAYYDAVWSLAFALNNSIEQLNKLNLSLMNYKFGQRHITNVIREQIEQTVSFEGLSGRIEFDSQTGFVDRIVNIYQINNGSVDLVAYYNAGDIVVVRPAEFINSTFEVNNIIAVTASLPVAVVIIIFTLLALLLLVASQVLSIIHRSFHSIKAASPKLNHLAFVGSYLIVLTIISFTVIKLSVNPQCFLWHVTNASLSTGSILIHGTVLAKTWRLYRILVHFQNPGRLISDRILFIFTLSLSSVGILVNSVWILTDPFSHQTVEATNSKGQVLIREHCATDYYYVWYPFLIGYTSIFIFASLYFAVLCHRVPVPRKEFKTNSVVYFVYSVSLVILCGFLVYFLAPVIDATFKLASLSITILLSVYLSLTLLFIPPILPLLKQKYLNRIINQLCAICIQT